VVADSGKRLIEPDRETILAGAIHGELNLLGTPERHAAYSLAFRSHGG
jgi:hypothetical protein